MMLKQEITQVVELAVNKMVTGTGLRGLVRSLGKVSLIERKGSSVEMKAAFDLAEEAAEYIHTLQIGLLPISYDLKELTVEEFAELIVNVSVKYAESSKLNFDDVQNEVNKIYSKMEMVA